MSVACRGWALPCPLAPNKADTVSIGRSRTPPLRKRNKRCNGRATARIAPTEA